MTATEDASGSNSNISSVTENNIDSITPNPHNITENENDEMQMEESSNANNESVQKERVIYNRRDKPKACNVIGIFGLSYQTQEEGLKELFAEYGTITAAKLIIDNHSGQSKGFAFVYYETEEEATAAINAMNGATIDGKSVRVDYSATLKPRSPTPGKYLGAERLSNKRPRGSGIRESRRDRSRDRYSSTNGSGYSRAESRDYPPYRRDPYQAPYDEYHRPTQPVAPPVADFDYHRSAPYTGRGGRLPPVTSRYDYDEPRRPYSERISDRNYPDRPYNEPYPPVYANAPYPIKSFSHGSAPGPRPNNERRGPSYRAPEEYPPRRQDYGPYNSQSHYNNDPSEIYPRRADEYPIPPGPRGSYIDRGNVDRRSTGPYNRPGNRNHSPPPPPPLSTSMPIPSNSRRYRSPTP